MSLENINKLRPMLALIMCTLAPAPELAALLSIQQALRASGGRLRCYDACRPLCATLLYKLTDMCLRPQFSMAELSLLPSYLETTPHFVLPARGGRPGLPRPQHVFTPQSRTITGGVERCVWYVGMVWCWVGGCGMVSSMCGVVWLIPHSLPLPRGSGNHTAWMSCSGS